MVGTAAGDDGAAPSPPDDLRDDLRDDLDDDLRDDLHDDTGADATATSDPVPFVVPDDIATRVANARVRHGRGGAMLAAGMLGLDQAVNGRKPREEIPVVVDAAGEPGDVDRDGIRLQLDRVPPDGATGDEPDDHPGDGTADTIEVVAPPLPRRAPVVSPATRGARRRWR